MRPPYLELVGLRVTFEKAVERYRLDHYYRQEEVKVIRPPMVMRGYEMERKDDIAVLSAGLRKAYAPVILSIWTQGDILTASEYLQFHVGARPDELELDGDWSLETP